MLRNAEVNPDGHVWDLIDHELNIVDAQKRSGVFRVISGLLLLLLISGGALVLLVKPVGIPAYILSDNTAPAVSSGLWAMHSSVQTAAFEEVRTTSRIASESSLSAQFTAADITPAADFVQMHGLAADPISAAPEWVMAELNRNMEGRIAMAMPLPDRMKENTYVNLATARNTATQYRETLLRNDINVPAVNTVVRAMDEMVWLNPANQHIMMKGQWSGSLIETGLLMTTTVSASEIAEMNTVETAQAETALTWIDDAMNELDSWKKEVEKADKPAEPQSLIEQAVLEEDDPWTKKQKEIKDLYRTHDINRGFHIGVIGGFQNTWVTRATRNTEVNRENVEYRANPGYQAGINLGYDITPHFGLMAEVKYSDEGMHYYNPDKDREEHLDLKYLEIPVYAVVKHSKMSKNMRPMVFNYLVGATFSDMRSVKAFAGDREVRFGQDYNTSEWGLSAGFDYDLYFNKNFYWSIGVRGGISGNSRNFPKLGDEGHPVSYDVGVYTRFNFRLPHK